VEDLRALRWRDDVINFELAAMTETHEGVREAAAGCFWMFPR
jgi:hypothetical protein